eukprot:4490760-Pleurochrysis_carterae.AAC.1
MVKRANGWPRGLTRLGVRVARAKRQNGETAKSRVVSERARARARPDNAERVPKVGGAVKPAPELRALLGNTRRPNSPSVAGLAEGALLGQRGSRCLSKHCEYEAGCGGARKIRSQGTRRAKQDPWAGQ